MRITGFRHEKYLMKMDRPIADCNQPEGVELLPGSILFLETDENITGLGFGFGGEFDLHDLTIDSRWRQRRSPPSIPW